MTIFKYVNISRFKYRRGDRRLSESGFTKGIFKIGSAIPAQIKREAVKVCQGAGKMHQAILIITVLQAKKVPQFMQGNFGCPFVQAG